MDLKKILGSVRRRLYGLYDKVQYHYWLKSENVSSRFDEKTIQKPLISIIVPTYNTDLHFLNEMVGSVIDQSYQNWELILVDDNSPKEEVRETIKSYTAKDDRIKAIFLKKNKHIAGATNEGIKVAKGSYIGLLDHDDILLSNALIEVAEVINKQPGVEFIYTDEDKIIGNTRMQPFFKPSLNVKMLHAINYITHFSVIKKTTLEKVGYEREAYNGAQDWELFLRIVRNIAPENIFHIPKILYSWRIHELSTSKDIGVKPYVIAAQEKAIRDDLSARGDVEYGLELNKRYSGQWVLSYPPKDNPKTFWTHDISSIDNDILSKYDYLVVSKNKRAVSVDEENRILKLTGEASTIGIGFVVTGSRGVWIANLEKILNKDQVKLVRRLSHISISRHVYSTVRYAIPEVVDYEYALIETKKLRDQGHRLNSVGELSKDLNTKGIEHLYVPYRDLL